MRDPEALAATIRDALRWLPIKFYPARDALASLLAIAQEQQIEVDRFARLVEQKDEALGEALTTGIVYPIGTPARINSHLEQTLRSALALTEYHDEKKLQ